MENKGVPLTPDLAATSTPFPPLQIGEDFRARSAACEFDLALERAKHDAVVKACMKVE